MSKTLANLAGLALTWGAWLAFINLSSTMSPAALAAIAILCMLALVPVVLIGRWLLDHEPTRLLAEWTTLLVHYPFAILFGAAIIAAVRFGQGSDAWPIPLPPWLGLAVMILSGMLLSAVVVNLAARGLGLPFAAALTRLVVTDWIYAWTRNPMVMSALAFLLGLGLWLRSGLFIVWLLVVVSPAMLVFLKVYEERELEVRFGQPYLDYKSRTPMLFPRRPAGGHKT